jgi:hypothetical protein
MQKKNKKHANHFLYLAFYHAIIIPLGEKKPFIQQKASFLLHVNGKLAFMQQKKTQHNRVNRENVKRFHK